MKRLKTFFLALGLFLLLPLPCSSESLSEEKNVVLTEAEWNLLKKNIAILETNLETQENLLKGQAESIKKASMQLENANQSLKQLKKETLMTEIKIGIVSFSAGAFLGLGFGFWIASK